MGRIPKEEIERLKQDVALSDVVESYGVKLEPKGKELVGLCPWHNDTSPSLIISDNNLWSCLGQCQEGGDLISWVQKAEGVSFRHAVEILKERWTGNGSKPAVVESGVPKVVKRSTVPKLDLLFSPESDSQELLNKYVEFCHDILKNHDDALKYMEKRNIKNDEAIEKFKLGFSNRSLAYRLPDKKRRDGAVIRGKLQEVGILRKSGFEHFNGSLVIPVFNEAGDVTEIYGRKIANPRDLRKGTPLHVYLAGPHKGVWNVRALADYKEIILCEALIDALTFWSHGFRNVTSSYGINGFTRDHLEAFKRYGTKRVLIAYDRDNAGDSAAEKVSKLLADEGIQCLRIKFPQGMDANEFAQKMQPVDKSLKVLIRNAAVTDKTKKPIIIEDKPVKEEAVSLFDTEAQPRELLKQYVKFCHAILKNSPQALNYLEKRNLTNSKIIDKFKLGFSNGTLYKHIPGYEDTGGY